MTEINSRNKSQDGKEKNKESHTIVEILENTPIKEQPMEWSGSDGFDSNNAKPGLVSMARKEDFKY